MPFTGAHPQEKSGGGRSSDMPEQFGWSWACRHCGEGTKDDRREGRRTEPPPAACDNSKCWLAHQVVRLSANDPALDALDLSSLPWDKCRLGQAGAREVAAALAGNTVLSKLNLTGNGICDEGATAVAEALDSNPNHNLRALDVRDNDVTAAGAAKLLASLARASALETLRLGKNYIADAGATAVAEALAGSITLRTLDLHCNGIGAPGATKVATALARNTALTDLNIGANAFGAEGGGRLADALKMNTTLTDLDLRNVRICASGARKMAEMFEVNTTLMSLDIGEWQQDYFFSDSEQEAASTDEEKEVARRVGLALRARPRPRGSFCEFGLSLDFYLSGVELADVAGLLGLPPAAADWGNEAIVRFFWKQQERRVAVCSVMHPRLGARSMWRGLDEGIWRMVLALPIHSGEDEDEDEDEDDE